MNKYGEALNFHLVDVPDIESDIPRSEFDENALKYLANKIVETGCLLKPLVLKQIAPMQLKVLAGHFEYHAAVMANELDTQRVLSGMVSAFVVKSEAEAYAIEQANLLTAKQNTVVETPVPPKVTETNDIHSLENRITDNIISRLTREVQLLKIALQQEFQKQTHSQNLQYQALLNEHQTLLNAVNKLQNEHQTLLNVVNKLQKEHPTTPNTTAAIPQNEARPEIEADILQAFNTWDETQLMTKLRTIFSVKKATKIAGNLIAERSKTAFASLKDITKRKVGIGDATMEKIMDKWSIN
jgi:DNA uptake protein ComE-like DNA-binding protein